MGYNFYAQFTWLGKIQEDDLAVIDRLVKRFTSSLKVFKPILLSLRKNLAI